VHGFRSSFKDFAHELAPVSAPNEVIEQCLGHRIRGSVEQSYRRGDLLARRAVLMGAWESFCFGGSAGGAKVVKLRG
jgi:integrase